MSGKISRVQPQVSTLLQDQGYSQAFASQMGRSIQRSTLAPIPTQKVPRSSTLIPMSTPVNQPAPMGAKFGG